MIGIWVYLADKPLLWLTLTVLVYWLARALFDASGAIAVLNPVLVSVAVLAATLVATGTAYNDYFAGARFISFLLGPATIALAVPLAANRGALRALWLSVTAALAAGALTAIATAFTIGWALGLDVQTLRSLLPKSITTPIAMAVSREIGGAASLTAIFVILTGITGAVIGLPLLRVLGLADPEANGFALGVAAHGIGTARALEYDHRAGAFASLALGLNGAFTAVVLPGLVWLAGG